MMLPRPSVAISTSRFDAVIFDLDGVITDTARVHFAAWQRLFDEYLTATDSAAGSFTDGTRLDRASRPVHPGVELAEGAGLGRW